MVTIEQITNKVIERIRAFPHEAKFSQADVGPRTSWDEYMEQLQYEEYHNFDMFQETVDTMVDDAIEELSYEDIELVYHSYHNDDYQTDMGEMYDDIRSLVLYYLIEEARSGDIEYNSPLIKYVKYYEDEYCEDDQFVVAEVIEKLNPSDYLFHVYSKETSPEGKDEIIDLTYLEQDCFLEGITVEMFEEIKNSFNIPTQE